MSILVSLVSIIAGVFFTVVAIVSLVKVLQIAEDVRAIRCRQDRTVKPPKPYTDTLKLCLLVSVLIIAGVILLVFYAVGMQNLGSFPKVTW